MNCVIWVALLMLAKNSANIGSNDCFFVIFLQGHQQICQNLTASSTSIKCSFTIPTCIGPDAGQCLLFLLAHCIITYPGHGSLDLKNANQNCLLIIVVMLFEIDYNNTL